MYINDKKIKHIDLETDLDELDLMYKDGAIGTHELYKHFGLYISYEEADELWGNYSEDIWHVSFETFPKENVKQDITYASYLFIQLYLYKNNVVTNDGASEYLEDALAYVGFIKKNG